MLYLDQEDIRILKGIVQLHKNNHIQYVNVIKKGGLLDWASVVCGFYGISLNMFLSPKRDRDLVYARRDFVHLVSNNTPHTCNSIARFMKRDHTSVLYHRKCKPINANKIKLEINKAA